MSFYLCLQNMPRLYLTVILSNCVKKTLELGDCLPFRKESHKRRNPSSEWLFISLVLVSCFLHDLSLLMSLMKRNEAWFSLQEWLFPNYNFKMWFLSRILRQNISIRLIFAQLISVSIVDIQSINVGPCRQLLLYACILSYYSQR